MSRPLRIEYPGAFYHVMNRGANRNVIFIDENADRFLFKKAIGEAVDRWKIRVHAFSLMDNHYHLLIETPLPNISRAMRHIDGVYTQRFNRRYGRDGALFRGRFKSILVEKESYFLELVRYIHLNGVKARLYPSPHLDGNSSHWDYLHPNQAVSWLERSLVLSYFQNTSGDAEKALHQFVLEGVPEELAQILARKKWPAVLGVKSFVASIRETYLRSQNKNRDLPQKNQLLKTKALNPTVVMDTVNAAYQNDGTRIERRWALVYFLRKNSFLSYKQIGCRDLTPFSVLQVVGERAKGNPEMRLLEPVNKSTASLWFNEALAEAGIKEFSFHCLRHTFASHMLAKGTAIYIVSKMLGHSTVLVTEQHYGHLDRRTLSNGIYRIDGILNVPVALKGLTDASNEPQNANTETRTAPERRL